MSSVDFGLDVALISIAEGHTNLDLARSALPANCKIPFMAGPDPNPDVSLIICTRNRFEQLAPCLETVQRIEFERPWELIIVNNGSDDATALTVQEFIKAASFPVHHVTEPKMGLGHARNAGVAAASAEILAFTDDDCYPTDEFLSRVWSAFRDPSLGYVTGRILLHDSRDLALAIQDYNVPVTFPGKSFIHPGGVQGANMAFRRDVLRQIGGFDPLFGAGSLFPAEDLDAANRASATGWKGQYRPDIVVHHHHGRKASDAARMWKSYGLGIGACYMKLFLHGPERVRLMRFVRWVHRRDKCPPGFIFWEAVGAAKYSYVRTAQIFGKWVR
jgi:glycosyltransferase involved in cell wall biosynthesis